MTALLSPRLLIALVLVAVLGFSHFSMYRKGRADVRQAWDAAKVTQERAAQEQAARMRELQRQAELHYTVQAEARDRFIVQTVREVRHASESLAACPLPADLRGLLHGAAACARGDSAAACGPGEPVRDAR